MPEPAPAPSLPEQVWYGGSALGRGLSLLLAPLGWLYCALAMLRALAYRRGWRASFGAGAPVIVVGNLTVGGTGKTPLVLWLVQWLRRQQRRPGVVLRGYGGSAGRDAPVCVPADGDPAEFGDEACLLAVRGGCPVVVGRDRVAAAHLLVRAHGCDIVVADDGLQHHRLRRDIEILVIDGARRFGNGRCLPAGPLREPARRAARADLVLVNGPADDATMRMDLIPGAAVNLYDPALQRPLAAFAGGRLTAVAGIGNPDRFFATLRRAGLTVDARPFADHHRFSEAELAALPAGPVLMTEKDAVKCRRYARPEHWYLPVTAQPDAGFEQALEGLLQARLAAGAVPP